MSDMFEYLEAQAEEENLPFRNAAVVAIDRVERRFGSFVESAQGEKEFNARIALIKDQIEKIAAEVCEEYGYNDPEHIAKLALGQIEVLAARPEPEGRADATQKLKSQKPDGYYTEPSPKLNPGSAGDHMKNTNPPIPELDPDEKQNPIDKKWPWDEPIPMEGDGLVRTDVTKQKREQVGPNTQTFPDKGQADPVTAAMNWNNSDMDEDALLDELEDEAPIYADTEDLDNDYRSPEVRRQNSIDVLRAGLLKEDYGPDDEVDYGLSSDKMSKSAAERMDFNALSEIMTPSDAIGKLVEAGMPEHEAKDRIDFYVNHVDPGWAHKSWTSAVEKESLWDQSNPDFMEMSYDVGPPTIDSIRQVYEQHKNSASFETPQDAVNMLFVMYAENARTNDQIDTIAQMFGEAIGLMPSNVNDVKMQLQPYLAKLKTADHPGVVRDQIQMIEGVIERGVGRGGQPLRGYEIKQLKEELARLKAQEPSAAAEYYTPGMEIDPKEERRIKKEMPERIDNPMDDMISPSTQTKDMPVKYKMTASYYETFLKKQNEQ